MVGTSNQSVPVAWPLTALGSSFAVLPPENQPDEGRQSHLLNRDDGISFVGVMDSEFYIPRLGFFQTNPFC